MKKFTHAKANLFLAAYTAQELAPDERQAIEAHLETCAICQHDLEEIKHISSLLRSFALTDAWSTSSVSGSYEALQLPLIRSRRSSRRIPARRTAPRPRLITLIAALLTLALIISTAAIFTYAAQGNATLAGKGKTPISTASCLTPTSSVPTSTPTVTLSPNSVPTQSATPTSTSSPTPSIPTPTPIIRTNTGCTTPIPGETTTPTPMPSPTISTPPDLPTPPPTIKSFEQKENFQ